MSNVRCEDIQYLLEIPGTHRRALVEAEKLSGEVVAVSRGMGCMENRGQKILIFNIQNNAYLLVSLSLSS